MLINGELEIHNAGYTYTRDMERKWDLTPWGMDNIRDQSAWCERERENPT
jgi:hypothetical protein